jgi:predicted nucleic acid-binding protein
VYVVDASVWVSRFVDGDIHHETSHRWLAEMTEQGETIAAPALLFAEVAAAISRRTGRPELAMRALSLLQRLPNLRLVPIEVELAQMAGRLAADLGLRGADAVYVSLAYRLGVPLVTWDREQGERSAASIAVLTPQDVLAARD